MIMRHAVLLTLLSFVPSCARYEYKIVQPGDLATHIGSKRDARASVNPLEYRFRSVDSRLVIRIYNRTSDSIQLIGERSTVVSPDGQSHPLRSKTISPGTFIKEILPPPRPRVDSWGPTFGVGIGGRVDSTRHRYHPYHWDHLHGPRYLQVYGIDEAYYWTWKGESSATLNLVFRHNDKEFEHRFTFRRQKM